MSVPDQTVFLSETAAAGLWWRGVAAHEGRVCGAVGQLRAGTPEEAAELLQMGCARLAAEGCELALAPLDGDTWHSYRVITWSAEEPLFPGEPQTDGHWARWLPAAGFEPLAHYTSAKVQLSAAGDDAPLRRAAERLESIGVRLRPMVPADWDAELARLHEVSLASFQNAFLYVPLDLPAFRQLYEKARALADPRWILLAECEGQPVGYVFAFCLPGRPVLYVKTLAVLPQRRFAGLGSVLLDAVQQRAHAAGLQYAIHCLQHEANTSLRVSSRYQPEIIRRYTLFAKPLHQGAL